MLLRANVLARGRSGIRPEIVELLLAMLNADLWPPNPEQGSVGASGDLAPLAHLALTLLGEGELRHARGEGPAATVLRAAGLRAVTLGPKEGLALINGTQVHTALAALAVADAWSLWHTAHVAGAATLDALLGTPTAFDARIHAARGQEGQSESARIYRLLTADSAIRDSHRTNDPRVQDAYALRCMPQVHGPVRDALVFADGLVSRELNAATDNPLVFDDDYLEPVLVRHDQVGDDQIGRLLTVHPDDFVAVARALDGVAGALQHLVDRSPAHVIVIDQQDPDHT
jgi:histidine ammonia-lyase